MATGDAAAAPHGTSELSSTLLPSLAHEPSAAVLIVDLARQAVTYANDLAREFVPGRALPIPVDEWSTLAGLEDVAGSDLPGSAQSAPGEPDSDEPSGPALSLLRIAGGVPLTGEAVTALRKTSATRAREVLWVIGLSLTDAPDPIHELALVVFLPARNAVLVSDAQRSAFSLRERAVLSTRISFSITDPRQPDNPLVWVNPAFSETTGYSFESAVGRNCRFLQGPGTDRAVVAQIGASLAAERSVTTTLLNYRPDGSHFWNELSVSPVRDESGTVTHFVGVQADVTSRIQAQQSRDSAMVQVAQAADRLALLADVTARVVVGRAPMQIVQTLADVLVPRVGTLGVVLLLADSGEPSDPHLIHAHPDDPTIAQSLEKLRVAMLEDTVEQGPIRQVLRGALRHALLPDYPRPEDEPVEGLRELLIDELSIRSMVAVPLRARDSILGVVVVMSDDTRPPLDDDDLLLVRDIALRAGLMLENTQLYARERATAATLQRSLLPRLPTIAGLEIAASYVPAADQAAVGGDWYDVFPLRQQHGESRGVGVAVGDVMGHNYDSAARMGKLSTVVRAYGWPGSDPFTVLTAVDELLADGELDYMATCFYGTLTLRPGGATLRYSSAGHPPAIVRRPGGSAITLDDARGPMIGISRMLPSNAVRPRDASIDLASGSTLICFTDGLTDGFAAEPDLDAGLAELTRLTEALPAQASPHAIVDELTHAAIRHNDDVALVAIRIL